MPDAERQMQSIPKIQRNPVLSLKQDTSNGIIFKSMDYGVMTPYRMNDLWLNFSPAKKKSA
jgi:hypothetical protein